MGKCCWLFDQLDYRGVFGGGEEVTKNGTQDTRIMTTATTCTTCLSPRHHGKSNQHLHGHNTRSSSPSPGACFRPRRLLILVTFAAYAGRLFMAGKTRINGHIGTVGGSYGSSSPFDSDAEIDLNLYGLNVAGGDRDGTKAAGGSSGENDENAGTATTVAATTPARTSSAASSTGKTEGPIFSIVCQLSGEMGNQ